MMTHSIKALNGTTLSVMISRTMPSIVHADCHAFFIVTLSAIMLNVIMLNVVILSLVPVKDSMMKVPA
jgi:hypothetical protein